MLHCSGDEGGMVATVRHQRSVLLFLTGRIGTAISHSCAAGQDYVSKKTPSNKDVPVSGRHGDTAQSGMARSGMVPTWPDMVQDGAAWLE